MDDFDLKISKVMQPLHLTTVEVLGLTEVHQILVVSEDLDRKEGAVKVVPLGFQYVDDYKELLVIDVVVSFSRDEQLGEVRAEVSVTIGVSLEEGSTRGIL